MESTKIKINDCCDQIRNHEKEIERLYGELEILRNSCVHVFADLKKKDLNDEWMSVNAICTSCGKYFGWRCKISPDFICHYKSTNGQIELINGEKIPTQLDHDPEYESDDCCIFCGDPEERK